MLGRKVENANQTLNGSCFTDSVTWTRADLLEPLEWAAEWGTTFPLCLIPILLLHLCSVNCHGEGTKPTVSNNSKSKRIHQNTTKIGVQNLFSLLIKVHFNMGWPKLDVLRLQIVCTGGKQLAVAAALCQIYTNVSAVEQVTC